MVLPHVRALLSRCGVCAVAGALALPASAQPSGEAPGAGAQAESQPDVDEAQRDVPPAGASAAPRGESPAPKEPYRWIVGKEPEPQPEPEAPAEEEGGARLRAGISLGGGAFLLGPLQAGLANLTARLGVQSNELFAFTPEVSFQLGSTGDVTAFAGGLTLPIDFTYDDILVIGFGLGGGFAGYDGELTFDSLGGEILPGGIAELRVGGYPLVHVDEGGARRGLLLSGEARLLFPFLFLSTTFNVGYEVF